MRKIYTLVTIIAVIVLVVSCTEQKPETNIKVAGLIANPTELRIYPIANVGKPIKGKPADFSWTEGSQTISFAEITKGKVVLLNFWATWCGPCRKEIPDIIQISNSMSSKGVMVIGVALEKGKDANLNISKVKTYAEKQGIPYINIIGNESIMEAYGGIGSIPQTLIIDKAGRIAETMVGSKSKEELMESINRALK